MEIKPIQPVLPVAAPRDMRRDDPHEQPHENGKHDSNDTPTANASLEELIGSQSPTIEIDLATVSARVASKAYRATSLD